MKLKDIVRIYDGRFWSEGIVTFVSEDKKKIKVKQKGATLALTFELYKSHYEVLNKNVPFLTIKNVDKR